MSKQRSRRQRDRDGVQPRLVPLTISVPAGRESPVTAYMKVARRPWSFLFESVEGGTRWGRYSMIGCDPVLTFQATRAGAVIEDGHTTRRVASPLQGLRDTLAAYSATPLPEMPPLMSGLVGYFGFEASRLFEPRLARSLGSADLPDIALFAPGTILAFDNLNEVLHVTVLADRLDGSAGVRRARERIDELLEELAGPAPEEDELPVRFAQSAPLLEPCMTRDDFLATVARAKEAILSGEAIQVVLSHAFSAETSIDPLTAYRALRLVSPSPYLFHLALGEETLVGASPEVMVRVREGQALLRPLAGTRPRGATPSLDQALEAELVADEKERAEHLMLLDLGRNDLGRVAVPGGVAVEDAFVVERYSHVMHLTSTISARLGPGTQALDVLGACFPAGTVSGAPKVRAIELIAELEPQPRGPYSGCVGYLAFDGSADTCIAIRTMLFSGGRVRLQAGAGIVADSDPEREYEETLHKAASLCGALDLAAIGLRSRPANDNQMEAIR